MKKYIFNLFLILLLMNHSLLPAQDAPCDACGEYYLEGLAETASGFKLNPDSTFEFFFSSGALDRYGSGNWHHGILKDGKPVIFLNSGKTKGKGLSLVNAHDTLTGKWTARIINGNPSINPYFYLLGFTGMDTLMAPFGSDGMAELDYRKVDSLMVVFEFCPDHALTIVPEGSNNKFEIKVEDWLFEYLFKDFHLIVSAGGLTGRHPLLQGDFTYTKR